MPIFREDTRALKAPENWVPLRAGRQREAHYVQMEDAGGAEDLITEATYLACGKAVDFRPTSDGDGLSLTFDVPKAGQYRFFVVMGLCPQSGKVGVELNGEAVNAADGGPWTLDLFTPFHTMLRHYELPGKVELPAGQNEITFISRGKNRDGKGRRIVGDFLWFQP
jgi:hypothetical protein